MINSKIILAVVGLPGAGKSEASEYIKAKTGWAKVHFGETVVDEVKNRGLEVNEVNERTVREDLRKQHGMAAMAILNLSKIKELAATSSVILESFYSWEEYLEVKKEFGDSFKVLAIYASPAIRSQRLVSRPVRPLAENEFISRDYSQIESLHQAGPIARADWTIINEGTKEHLNEALDKFLSQLL